MKLTQSVVSTILRMRRLWSVPAAVSVWTALEFSSSSTNAFLLRPPTLLTVSARPRPLFLTSSSSTLSVPQNATLEASASSESILLVPPPPSAISISNADDDDDDAFFRRVRQQWPLKLQYWLRDSGLLRTVVDVLTLVAVVPQVLQQHSEAWLEFLHLSGVTVKSPAATNDSIRSRPVAMKTISYGPSPQQVIHLIQPKDGSRATTKHLVVFVHGGAWGSGFPALYRLVAKPFLKQQSNTKVAIVGYRTYPNANCAQQAQDVAAAVRRLAASSSLDDDDDTNIDGDPQTLRVTLVGHSSGAHICALALLRGLLSSSSSSSSCQHETALFVDQFVRLSGVYEIPAHYQFEKTRGVERISPMSQAAATAAATGSSSLLSQWRQQSPTYLVQQQHDDNDDIRMPPTLLLHGECDSTVPYRSSINFAAALARRGGNRCDLLVLPNVEHAETVVDLMFEGAASQTVWEWMTD